MKKCTSDGLRPRPPCKRVLVQGRHGNSFRELLCGEFLTGIPRNLWNSEEFMGVWF